MTGAAKLQWPIEGLDLTLEYGLLNPNVIEEKRNILKLSCTDGDYALKCNQLSARTREFLTQVFRFLQARQFAHYIGPIPNCSGDYFVLIENSVYSVMQWLPGRECCFGNLADLLLYAQTLGKLHQATVGFAPVCGPWQKHWQTKFESLKALDLDHVPHARKLKSLLPVVMRTGEKVLAIMQDPDVQVSLAQPAVVCHHDLTYRNGLIAPDNQCYLIDFDMATADTPARDLAQFLLNALKRQAWQPNVALEIIKTYALQYPLTRGDLGLALAFMYFPRSLWSLADRVKQGQNVIDLANKVESVLARQPFLNTFGELFDFRP